MCYEEIIQESLSYYFKFSVKEQDKKWISQVYYERCRKSFISRAEVRLFSNGSNNMKFE